MKKRTWVPFFLFSFFFLLLIFPITASATSLTISPDVKFGLMDYDTYIQFDRQRTATKVEVYTDKVIFYNIAEEVDVIWYSVKYANLTIGEIKGKSDSTVTYSMTTNYEYTGASNFSVVNVSIAGLDIFDVEIEGQVDGDEVRVDSLTTLNSADYTCYYLNSTYFVAKIMQHKVITNTEYLSETATITLTYSEEVTSSPGGGVGSYTLTIQTLTDKGDYLPGVRVEVRELPSNITVYSYLSDGEESTTLKAGTYLIIGEYEGKVVSREVGLYEDKTVKLIYTITYAPQPEESLIPFWLMAVIIVIAVLILVIPFFGTRESEEEKRRKRWEGVYQ